MFIDDVLEQRKGLKIKIDGIVDVTNVWQYCQGLAGVPLTVPTDIFSLLPPFESTWFQFRSDEGWVGALAYVTKQKDGAYWIEYNWFVPFRSKDGSHGYVNTGSHVFHTDSLGKAEMIDSVRISPEIDETSLFFEQIVNKTNTLCQHQEYVFFTALNFLYCKNVELLETKLGNKLIKTRKRQGKKYFEKTYTLAIEPMKKSLDVEGGAQTLGLKQAFHLCRGHFRTYDEDSKGLFGRYHGTYWVPAHPRGNAEIGKIAKDYRVKVPAEKPE